MKYQLNNKQYLPLLPSLHDCTISNVIYNEDKKILSLIIKDLSLHDSIINQGLNYKEVEVIFKKLDNDFCILSFQKYLFEKENNENKLHNIYKLSGYNCELVDLKEGYHRLLPNNSGPYTIISFYVGYNSIIIKLWKPQEACEIELLLEEIEYLWK